MGSVVLALTGAEALYADMGHFGRQADQGLRGSTSCCPHCCSTIWGRARCSCRFRLHQVATAVQDPFFYLAPDTFRLPLVIIATLASIIASQAVISGAFSVTQQAIQLGFVPRLRITHTSESCGRPDLHPARQLGADDHGAPAGR